MYLSKEAVQGLLDQVNDINALQQKATDATAESNAKHAELQKAQSDVANADAAEATAHGDVKAALGKLTAFVEGLNAAEGPDAPPPPSGGNDTP